MSHDLLPSATAMVRPATVGAIANQVAVSHALGTYQQRLSANTKRRQQGDLALFARYLSIAGLQVSASELMTDPTSWQSITYGLIVGFIRYQLREGYAIGSLNVRLATVKRYCAVAFEANALDAETLALIANVRGFSHKDGRNVDQGRAISRRGQKKAEPVTITADQAAQLKREQPATPQGSRDALLMCLLLDHGLRCGEIAALTIQCVNMDEETLTFYRAKVDLVQTHELTKDTRTALRRYLAHADLQPGDYLLRGSHRSGKLAGRMSERAITARMKTLGQHLGIASLSAHDGRHSWATLAIKAGTDVKALQVAGGWKSPSMPIKYAITGKIANAGILLPK
jgi:integrase